jgi:hypothetical protein
MLELRMSLPVDTTGLVDYNSKECKRSVSKGNQYCRGIGHGIGEIAMGGML